jgi:excisionase family DNA binding protein
MADSNEWLSLGETAAMLGVHPTTLRHWANNGDIPSQRTPGGHRRFQRRVVEGWASSRSGSSDVAESEAQVMIESAIGHARLIVGAGQLDGLPWYDRLDETTRDAHRSLGRQLLGLLTRYLAGTENRAKLLHEVQQLGAEYARQSLAQNLNLAEIVQAFLFFKDMLIESVIQMAEPFGWRSPAEWGSRLKQVNTMTDELLLVILEEYSSVKR